MEAPPVEDAYWVDPGRLLAGRYPGADDERLARARLARFAAAGIGLFVDLTEPGELPHYAHALEGADHVRMPIRDMGTTSTGRYRAMLDLVDDGLAAGKRVYVHCYGGVGRTGTLVGCWLVRHSLDGGDPIRRIAELRIDAVDSWLASPQTIEQRHVVLGWEQGG